MAVKSRKHTVLLVLNLIAVTLAILIALSVMLFPVLRIYGNSMSTTLSSGDIVLSVKGSSFSRGDIVAFYYNSNILVKRVIATEGESVDIDFDGNVRVGQELIDEPYVNEKTYGEPDVKFPYEVPEDRLFVLGDNRKASVDSRQKSIGCVSSEQIAGKVVFRIWPLDKMGPVR